MKKTFIFLAAAAALVACSKNEETSYISPADNEISYIVAPKTKAATTTEFNNTWTFKSTAFYLPTAESWATHTTTPTEYIKGVDISYNTTDGVWRNATKKYYWPKDGKLTFFAWTSLEQGDDVTGTYDNTKKVVTLTENQTVSYLTSGVNVNATDGVKIENYDVTTNKNYDLLVADIKADQTKNTDPKTYYKVGVPTLFRHKLSQVLFSAVTVDSNKAAYDYKTNDSITFTLNSITFTKIDKINTYTQGVSTTSLDGAWGTASATDNLTYANYTSGKELTSTVTPLVDAGNLYYYLPQTFEQDKTDSDCFVVSYKITYANGTEENLTATFPLNSATAENVIFDKWEMGKRYTINLKFSLNEILWDPAVQDWEDVNKEVTVS